jgi:hypothetical protein
MILKHQSTTRISNKFGMLKFLCYMIRPNKKNSVNIETRDMGDELLDMHYHINPQEFHKLVMIQ